MHRNKQRDQRYKLLLRDSRTKNNLRAADVIQKVLASLVRNFRSLLLYHLFFTLLSFVLLAPAFAWLSTRLLSSSGLPQVGPEEVLAFLASPAGAGWLLTTGSLSLLLIFIHHSGMIIIAANSSQKDYYLVTAAFWHGWRRLPDLLALAAIQAGVHLLVALPFLLGVGAAWSLLLSPYDPYYLVSELPMVFKVFLGICSVSAVVMLICNGFVYLRWVLAFPVLLLEDASPMQALKKSARFSHGYRLRMAALVVAVALSAALVPGLLLLIFEALGTLILGWLPEKFSVLIPAVLIFLSFYTILVVLASFLGTAVNSLFIQQLYRAVADVRPVAKPSPPPPRTGVLAWGLELVLLVFALGSAGVVLHSFFDFQDRIYISAHRGSSMLAPENTMPAIEQAIEEGADYVELDVRQTADGVPILLHDRDLRRIAGKSSSIWELGLEQVHGIDAGGWFHPEYVGVGIPTLEEAIHALRGRAQLYLEIKPSPDTPGLTESVVKVLQEQEFIQETIVASLNPEILQEAKSLEPGLRTSFFAPTAMPKPDLQGLDALAMRAGAAKLCDLRELHRQDKEFHVWTVNKKREMSRFIDMGVDNIITDRPGVLAELLQQRAELSDVELFLIKLRNWLQG